MSKETVIKKPQVGHTGPLPVPIIRALPPQITKLMKEEDEETWISGEELCTEGSSDDEDTCRYKKNDQSSSSKPRYPPTNIKTQEESCPRVECVESSSKGESSVRDHQEASDDDDRDDKISWKANRDLWIFIDSKRSHEKLWLSFLNFTDESLGGRVSALQGYKRRCEETDQWVTEIYKDFLKSFKHFENAESDLIVRRSESLIDEMRRNVNFFDSKIQELHSRVEIIKEETMLIQRENRIRLREVVRKDPIESNSIAQNTKSFMDLCVDA
ncbi:uncharacterized protein LOC106638852 [Copidosoma floridanum]|uniref:uncharacterized protein LOC106638852 n=1 Tax=Copidosoma floridanum TaxID=29053 RepID=UPI0006C99486|nr:uncharacterized protein LOC106638852 [Copidosoma floridanum]